MLHFPFQILVLQVAFSESSVLSEEAYLVGVWAVALCTIVGPLAFTQVVKRGGKGIVIGKWGKGETPSDGELERTRSQELIPRPERV